LAIREVIRMGDPRLLREARPVEHFGTPELEALLVDMLDTMKHMSGAGLAAPQIAVDLQVVIFGGFRSPRYPDSEEIPFTVLLNPVLEPLSEDMEEGWEGCLSVPGMRGLVPRFTRLRYRGRDLSGNPIDRVAEGFHARVVQHECDHLIGKLYPMRIRDFSRFGYTSVLFPELDPASDD
jgi:peptide deformylase